MAFLQINSDYEDDSKKQSTFMKFEDFYQIFMVVCCQLTRADQNVLLMSKLFRLLSFVTIPEADKSHFFDLLGQVNQRALQTKDPIAFQHVLSSFITWAKSSELPDLTFMIPMHDREVAQIFMNCLGNSKYIFDEACNMEDLKKMIDLQCLMKSHKEAGDMDKFCRPSAATTTSGAC